MKSLFVKKSFAFLVFFASQFFCFAAGKNVKQLVPKEVTPVEYRNIYLNWNNEGTPQFFSYEDLQNDVNALNYLISTAYAGYEDAVKRGLNLETFAEQVDDYYYSYDRISTDDYIHTLTNFLEKKIRDRHFIFFGYDERWWLSGENTVYFSDVYCLSKKSDNDAEKQTFFVVESDAEEVKKGDEIEISEENLFPYILNGQRVHRLGIINYRQEKYLKLVSNGKTVYVPVKNYPAIKKHDSVRVGQKITKNSAYVSLTHFDYGRYENTVKSAEVALELFSSFGIKNKDKQNLIIDLRSNGGGYPDFLEMFYFGLYSGIDWKTAVKMTDKQRYNFYVCYMENLLQPKLTGAITVESPAWLQMYKNNVENMAVSKNNADKELRYLEQLLEEQKKVPQRRKYDYGDYIKYRYMHESNKKNIRIPKKSAFNGKIIIIADRNSASATELAILYARLMFDEDAQVYVIGENTNGCISYGDVNSYCLPESKVNVNIPISDFTNILKRFPAWHGEGYGFYPDYWCTSENILETLVVLSGDDELKSALHGIDYDLR